MVSIDGEGGDQVTKSWALAPFNSGHLTTKAGLIVILHMGVNSLGQVCQNLLLGSLGPQLTLTYGLVPKFNG